MNAEPLAAATLRLAAALGGASLAAVALVAGCAALLLVWRRLPPRIVVALWWMVALRILLELGGVPGIALPLLPVAPIEANELAESVTIERDATGAPAVEPRAPSESNAERPGLSGVALGAIGVAFAWLGGLATVIALEFRRGKRLAAVVCRARPVVDPRVRVAGAKAAAALGLERRVPLLVSDEIATPMVVGLFRPRLLLPADAALAGEELRLVLLHELAHVRRRDALFALVPALARRLFWFHPLVRYAEREYALATEAACDTEVLARTDAEPDRYGRLLVRFAAGDEGLSPALALSTHPLERRLRMLVSAPLDRRRLLLAAPLLLLVALAVALPVELVAAPPEPPVAPAVPAVPVAPAARPALLPIPAIAPVPPVAPAPPAPPVPSAGPLWSELDPGDALVLLDGDATIVVNASSADRRRARELAADGEPVLLIRRRGATWVIRDRAAVDEVRRFVDEEVSFEVERAEEIRARAEELSARLAEQVEAQREEVDRLAEQARASAEEFADRARALAAAESQRAGELAILSAGHAERELQAALREFERRREEIERTREVLEARLRSQLERDAGERDRERIERQLRRELERSGRDPGRDLDGLIEQLLDEQRAERLPE